MNKNWAAALWSEGLLVVRSVVCRSERRVFTLELFLSVSLSVLQACSGMFDADAVVSKTRRTDSLDVQVSCH